LACRRRDRVSALAAFFGDGPIEMDFAGVAERTAHVQTARVPRGMGPPHSAFDPDRIPIRQGACSRV